MSVCILVPHNLTLADCEGLSAESVADLGRHGAGILDQIEPAVGPPPVGVVPAFSLTDALLCLQVRRDPRFTWPPERLWDVAFVNGASVWRDARYLQGSAASRLTELRLQLPVWQQRRLAFALYGSPQMLLTRETFSAIARLPAVSLERSIRDWLVRDAHRGARQKLLMGSVWSLIQEFHREINGPIMESVIRANRLPDAPT